MRAALAALVLVIASVASAQSNVVLGRYAAVSESEWGVEIDLKPKHAVTLQISQWEPGERDKPRIERYQGQWSINGSDVRVVFKAGSATFHFQPQLGFGEFQREGSAPGLVGKAASFRKDFIVDRSLWLESELKKLK